MPRPSRHDYPAMLWYETSKRRKSTYMKHEAHVREYRTNPLGYKLRMYQSFNDHNKHVKAYEFIARARIASSTRHQDGHLIWTGRMWNNTPRLSLCRRNEQHPVTVYQRLQGVLLQPGLVWSRAQCEVPDCIAHRVLMSDGDRRREIANEVKGSAAYLASRIRSGQARSKINEQVVLRMRELRSAGLTYPQISEQTGVNLSTVRDVCTGQRWAHVTKPRTGISFITSQLLGVRA